MKILAILNSVGSMNVRQVNNPRTNQTEDFRTVGIQFAEGNETLYGEAVQEDAQRIVEQQVKNDMRGKLCWFDLAFAAKAFKTSDGREIMRTEVRVRRITPCW